jgi:hypothetical protein
MARSPSSAEKYGFVTQTPHRIGVLSLSVVASIPNTHEEQKLADEAEKRFRSIDL